MNNPNFNYYINNINNMLTKCYRQLEEYIYYIARCLKEKFDLNELVVVQFDKGSNNFNQSVVYPRSSVVDGEGIVNPMFFYGFKIEHDKEYKVKITFTENPEEIQ